MDVSKILELVDMTINLDSYMVTHINHMDEELQLRRSSNNNRSVLKAKVAVNYDFDIHSYCENKHKSTAGTLSKMYL